jgi:hypothetical protein
MSWKQYGNTILGNTNNSLLGINISMSSDGNIIAMVENMNDLNIVKVYRYMNEQWIQLGQNLENNIVGQNFGNDLKLSRDGTTLAIGSDSKDINGESNIGNIIVYRFDGNLWTQIGQELFGENSLDFFGTSIDLSYDGNVLVSGFYSHTDTNQIYGCVKTFRYSQGTNSWIEMGSVIKGNSWSSFSGLSLALNDNSNYLVVGYQFNTNSISVNQSGQVCVYNWNFTTQNWEILGSAINGETPFEQFGACVDISSDGLTVISGAPNYNLKTGLAKVYTWNGFDWIQKGQIINGENSSQFGICVSMCSDSNTIAIGAINSNRQGYVNIYNYINSVWNLKGASIKGEFNDDRDGYEVQLSSDGQRIIISAPFYDNNLVSNIGRVKTYQYINDTPVCFGENTIVLTDRGYRQITKLTTRDTIITSDGRHIKIKRILQSSLKPNKDNYLYIIPKNYLDTNYPPNNVYLTGCHLIKFKNNWILPSNINIDRVFTNDPIKVFNIELDNYITDHLVINNGCIIESYCNLNIKSNFNEYLNRCKSNRSSHYLAKKK